MKKIVLKMALISLGCAGAMNALALTLPSFDNLPLFFETAPAQRDAPTQFVARGTDCQFFISPAKVQIGLRSTNPATNKSFLRTVRMQFIGAASGAHVNGTDELSGKVNYLIGRNPADWRVSVATFARVSVEQLYPGVNLVYYGKQRQLEYDFAIAPGVNPDVIKIRFAGVDNISIGAQGELILALGRDEIRQPAPVIYQTVHGQRQAVTGGYRRLDAHTVAFTVGTYDSKLPLVIDPVLSFSTYLGGSGSDSARSIVLYTNTLSTNELYTNGFVYIAGQTLSGQLSTPGAFQTNFAGGGLTGDAFVAKFDKQGGKLIYITYLGGGADDWANSITVDGAGDAFVTGFTDSTDFPTSTNALYPTINGPPALGTYFSDGFIAELNPSGSNLVYSTYLGGAGIDSGNAIALDSSNNIYVTGYTCSTNFPTTPDAYQKHLGCPFSIYTASQHVNAFLTEIGASGTNLLYSSYFGGTNLDVGGGIAVDNSNYVYVVGSTESTNFPTKNPLQPNFGGAVNPISTYDAFVAKFAPSTTNLSLLYSTFLGGTNNDMGYAIIADTNGNAYVVGGTASPDFPNTITNVPNLYNGQSNNLVYGYGVTTNAFLTQIKWEGTNAAIGYSAVFGGTNSGMDVGYGLTMDPYGNVYVVGASSTTNFPSFNTPGLMGPTNAGGNDVFVTAFDPNVSGVIYSGYLGGSGDDYGYGIAVDSTTNVYIAGQTASGNFPTIFPYQSSLKGGSDAFLTKIGWTNDPPEITNQSSLTNRLVETGGFVTFSVSAIGTPPLIYHWQQNGTNLVNGTRITGATNATLNIYPTETNDSGIYQVVVSNYAGSVTSSNAVLTVTSGPFLTQQPTNETVGVGDTARFSVNGSALPPIYLQWLKDGVNLTDGTNASGSVIIGSTNSGTLTINNVQTTDAGNYWLIVTNDYGAVTSDVATLAVVTFPTILVEPTNQTVGAGSTVPFVVKALGTAPLSYQWQKNGNNLVNSGHISGATSSTMTVRNAQPSDNANYIVIITNEVGSVTSSPPAVLTVLTSPLFETITVNGTNGDFILSGVGGLSSDTYYVLTSTNLTTPLLQWAPVATNQFGTQGQFVFTNTPSTNTPQQFYLLQMQ